MLKTSAKEEEDFVILPDSAWKYLFDIYGGKDCTRYSILLQDSSDGEEEGAKK